jgi:immune inhibitor A
MLCLVVLLAALPLAAQEEDNYTLPGRHSGLSLVADEDGDMQLAGSDNFPSPNASAKAELRRQAVSQQLAARVKQGGKTHEVARGQYVDFPIERTDRIFVMLVEYGTQGAASATISQVPGPLHNTIAQPNRAVNNTTIWQADYNREHYVDMYFNKMVDYYRSQSSGRYTFNGDVAHWVKVPFNGSRYGNNTLGDAQMWTLIADTINTWTANELAAGKTVQEISDYLKTYDVQDRYDYDQDGNFDEPDGYIDHFQIVHAGAGEETGGGILGADAIWSHRWQAWYNFGGVTGPAYNKDGGVQFGGGWGANPNGGISGATGGVVRGINSTSVNAAVVQNRYAATPTGIWVGDYTVQPENGGLGVFAHEYGHDLGLPDHYDTSNAGTNGTGMWTIMSSGSYLGDGGEDIGSRPGDMSGWDKLQLGWLNYDLATHGKFSVHKLGPAENTTKAAQAVVIPLPPNQNVTFPYPQATVAAQQGKVWFSGTGNSYEASMIRSIDVPAATPTLSMRLAFNTEANWDYGYVSISTNGGATWTNLASAGLTTTTNPNGNNLGNGFTGASNTWRNVSFNLAAYAGQTVLLRIMYKTDLYDYFWGVVVDNITVGSFSDNAEVSPNGWTLNKFAQSLGEKVVTNNQHYYVAEYRQYRGYDTGLRTGPYHGTSYLNGYVGHYAYQDGLLVTYADDDWSNNNTSAHAGEGFALPVDARSVAMTRLGVQEPNSDRFWNFSAWTPTLQVFDATFGLQPTDDMLFPFVGTLPPLPGSPAGSPNRRVQFEIPVASKPAEPLFNDMLSYWDAVIPTSSVMVPQTGTTIRVISTSAQDTFMHLQVNGN